MEKKGSELIALEKCSEGLKVKVSVSLIGAQCEPSVHEPNWSQCDPNWSVCCYGLTYSSLEGICIIIQVLFKWRLSVNSVHGDVVIVKDWLRHAIA